MSHTLLVVDDSKTAREVILHSLSETNLFSNFLTAENGADALEILYSNSVDVILCDLHMPVMSGYELLQKLQKEKDFCDLPLILLTSQTEQKEKIRCLDLGACDYVTKPFDTAELKARVQVHLKLKILQDQLKEVANTDPLTGLGNRRRLFEMLSSEMARSQRIDKPFSLAMIDIDHFKKVNDTYGHMGGDKVLAELSKEIVFGIRKYDLATRFGGEEFAVVFPETTLDQAAIVAERIRARIKKISFTDELSDLRLSVSLGVATYPAPGIDTIDDLIREADNALYQAKKNGRDRIELAQATPLNETAPSL